MSKQLKMLLVSLVACSLAACGSGNSGNDTSSASPASGASSTPSTPKASSGGTNTQPTLTTVPGTSTPASTPAAASTPSTSTSKPTTSTPATSTPVTSTPTTTPSKPTTTPSAPVTSTPSTPASTPVVSTPASSPVAASTPAVSTAGTVLDTSFGVKGDGKTDDTKALQAAINGSVGQILSITGQSRINANGLDIPSNSHIRFASGASIKLLAYNTDSYQMLRVWDVSNVVIENAYLDGSRELNSASGGEWGMGISVSGSSNVTLTSPTTINCWGDGIYISGSQSGSGVTSSNVTVTNHVADNNRRQGVSIISGSNITFNNPIWKNTNGTEPAAGLDLEPDSNSDVLTGIRINNPQTSNNAGAGIQVYLGSIYGPIAKKVDIQITGHVDTNTGGGPFGVGGLGDMGSYSVTGAIVTTNPVWTEDWYKGDWSNNGPTISVVNATIK